VSPTSFNVGATQSAESDTVSALITCTWGARPEADWIAITSQAGGTSQNPGSGSFNFLVANNPDLQARSTNIDVTTRDVNTGHEQTTQILVSQNASSGGFTISSVNQPLENVVPGGSALYIVTLSRTPPFIGCVTLGVVAPQGTTARVGPAACGANGNTISFTLTASASICPGSNQFTVNATNGGVTASNFPILDVVGDFSLSVPSVIVVQGTSVFSPPSVSITRTSGYSNTVALGASGLPVGANLTFNPNSTTGNSSTLTISALNTTNVGTYPITITGSGGCLSHSTTFNLTISPNWWPAIQQILD
jgi:hypothetical protein